MRDPKLMNTMIDREMEYYAKYGPQLFPSVVINNQTFRGQLEVEAVFNAICAGFYNTPDFCMKYLETNDINNADLILMRDTNRRHSYFTVFLICWMISATIGCMLYMYRRSAKRTMQKQMQEQVESAVNQYKALSNKDQEAGDRASKSELQEIRK